MWQCQGSGMQGGLAVISDIHGHVDALRAVLQDVLAQGIDRRGTKHRPRPAMDFQ